jgi:hypothetical protein
MARLVVREVAPSQVFRADGERLRDAIERAWTDAEPLEVDFEGLRIASASFFDESFGTLALRHPIELVRRRLRPIHLSEPDRELLNAVLSRRARERRERQVLVELARLWEHQPERPATDLDVAAGTSLTEEQVRQAMPALEKAGFMRRMPEGTVITSEGRIAALTSGEGQFATTA